MLDDAIRRYRSQRTIRRRAGRAGLVHDISPLFDIAIALGYALIGEVLAKRARLSPLSGTSSRLMAL